MFTHLRRTLRRRKSKKGMNMSITWKASQLIQDSIQRRMLLIMIKILPIIM
jgi:hypothetical protein